MFSLKGKIALVTGGGGGIGQAIALALAQAGADVAVVTHNNSPNETRDLVLNSGARFSAFAEDLSHLDTAGMTALLEQIKHELGNVDILVNNAGIIRRTDAKDFLEDDWTAVMDLNINAVWRLTQACARRMLERHEGKIINIASLLSFQDGVRVPAYTASKHAIAGLTKVLANEWASRGINVNAIAPGYIATDNTQALRDDPVRAKSILERIPAGRWGNPEDLAGAAVFLASRASNYVNGHVLVVDGGWLAR